MPGASCEGSLGACGRIPAAPADPLARRRSRAAHRDLFLKPPTDKEWEAEFLPWFEGKTSKRPAISTSSVVFDYSRTEVLKYYFDTLREACRRYDLDGVELDW